jgi:hypothetical protein
MKHNCPLSAVFVFIANRAFFNFCKQYYYREYFICEVSFRASPIYVHTLSMCILYRWRHFQFNKAIEIFT